MSLQIQMIGTGSAFAKTFHNNNALIHLSDFTLMLDCGYTASKALSELHFPLAQIDAVVISHIHADHVGGLEELAFKNYYSYKRRIKLYVPSTLEHSLWEHTLRGALENRAENLTCLNDYFEVIPIAEREPIQIHPELKLELFPTEHILQKDSYGFLLNDSVYYSADTKFDRDTLLALHQNGCRHILHDCQFTSPGIVHASLEELLTLPEEVQKIVLLMHYSDDMQKYIGKTGLMTFMEQFKRYTLS